MNVYETITARIIETLESGIIPWRKEWKAGERTGHIPSNFITKKAYRGINVIMLMGSPYSSSQWLTYNQAKGIGAQVRKGERGTPIVFWKFSTRKDEKTGEDKDSAFCKMYTVFNVAQCEGIPAEPIAPSEPVAPFVADAAAQGIADAFFARPAAPTLGHGGDKAYFQPLADHVQMPAREAFTAPANYYHTVFHEMTHATGTASRLARGVESQMAFGSEVYSNEELVAEFGASFLSAEAGIFADTILVNAAAYIQGWLKALKNDKTLAVSAAQRAQKAADYILARTQTVTVESEA
jgi:antirestriction protein ArdC